MTRMTGIARTGGGLLTVGGLDLSPVAFPRYGPCEDRVWQGGVCCISELSPCFGQPTEAGLSGEPPVEEQGRVNRGPVLFQPTWPP